MSVPTPPDPRLPDDHETDPPLRDDLPDRVREQLDKQPAPPDPMPDPGPL